MKKTKKFLSKKLCYHYTVLEKENKKLRFAHLRLKHKITNLIRKNRYLFSRIIKLKYEI